MVPLILLLSLLAAFPPMSIDMYLPAIPYLQSLWQQPLSVINLTLVLFLLTYCISLLIYGPLSDRFGRKPPLMAGIVIFMIGCLICAVSISIWMLIAGRIVQAFGAASASAISMAIMKDRLAGKEREAVMGYVAVIMALAPMVSPMIGSFILEFLSWRWIFVMQGSLSSVALVGVFLTAESHPGSDPVSTGALVRAYFSTLSNRRFLSVVFCTSLIGIPFFAFIATSSNIYITFFGLSERTFSLFFGSNALCLMAGSLFCARFGSRISTLSLISAGFIGLPLAGIFMYSGILPGPWALAIPMGIFSFFLGLGRPPSNNLALEQVDRDVGVASSLLVFIYFICGAVGMAIASLEWSNKIEVIGLLGMICGGTVFVWWSVIRSRNIISVPV